MKTDVGARLALFAPLVASGLLVSGCMSSPTYGTGKTANAQLSEDLTGMLSFKPNKSTAASDYKPRPELVKPASLQELPPPQESMASADNPQWPESPEQRRARIRAEATSNQDNSLYESQIYNDMAPPKVASNGSFASPSEIQDDESRPMSNSESKSRGAEIRRKQVDINQGSPTKRKYLSEPPIQYRQPSDTASVGDLGEDEAKKERRLRKEASVKSGSRWRDMIPWL